MEKFINLYVVLVFTIILILSLFVSILIIGSLFKRKDSFFKIILDMLIYLTEEILPIFLYFSLCLLGVIVFINQTKDLSIDNKLIFIGVIFTFFNILFQNRPIFNKKVSVILEGEKIKIINQSNYNIQISQMKIQDKSIFFNNFIKNQNIEIGNLIIKNIPQGKIYLSSGSFIEFDYEKIKENRQIINLQLHCTYKHKILDSTIKSSLLI